MAIYPVSARPFPVRDVVAIRLCLACPKVAGIGGAASIGIGQVVCGAIRKLNQSCHSRRGAGLMRLDRGVILTTMMPPRDAGVIPAIIELLAGMLPIWHLCSKLRH